MKAFIIRVNVFEPSVKSADIVLKSCIDNGIDAQLFDGVDALNISKYLKKYKLQFAQGEELMARSPGTIGCFLSHYILWNRCVSLRKPILILEHDGIIERHIPDDIEFHDVLHLDGSRKDPDGPVGVSDYMFKHPRRQTYCFGGAYAYIIKPRAAKKLINRTKKYGMIPADNMISSDVLHMQKILPRVARLDTDYKYSLTSVYNSHKVWKDIINDQNKSG